ncbi:DNA repair protein REV1 [Araneus ventricosus]|uniref:DNA repair protein REV1 n=1 Tax=Araneus ventricosus TaxID=182803 RepID=A0A4Y2AM78_ARAVE|nr:DNA repair protein REV1 [Araneus ventricosus]
MASKQSEELSKKKSKHRKRRENGFEEWGGYMAAKKQKLEMQFEDKKALELMDQKETKIFKGIGIFVNGLTTPSADELKRLMLIHGGKFYHYPTSKITHVIASNLPKSKMRLLKTQVFVTGDWITDSIKAGKLLPHQNYFLYSPEVADKQQRLQIGNYFQKKSDSSSITETVKEDDTAEKKNKNTSMLEELFGEDLDSDSSIDSEQNAQCNLVNKNSLHKESSSNASYQKHSTSNHSKVSSPVKSSLTGSSGIAVSAQNQRISSNYSSNLKPSLSGSENHTFNESSLSKMKNKNKSILDELFGEDLESNSNTGSEQNIKSNLVNKNSPHKKSSANASYQKHGKSNHSRVSSPLKSSSNVDIPVSVFTSSHGKVSPMKSSSNVDIPVSVFTSSHGKVSPMKSSSNVDISVSSQNQSIPCKDSSHLKQSLNKLGNHTFNERSLSKKKNENKSILDELFGEDLDSDSSIDSEQNAKSISVNKNSPLKKTSSNVAYQKHGTSNHGRVSSPMKSSSNVDISVSTQNFTNNDSSHLKSSSSINNLAHRNVRNISVNQSTSNKESSYSKPSKSGDASISPQKHGAPERNTESSHSKPSKREHASISPQKHGASETNMKSSYSKPSKRGDASLSPEKHGRAVKAGDPNFLPEFFNHSRKHHISTSAQELKRYVQFLVERNKEKHFPKRERLRELSQQFPNDSSFITSDPKAKGRQHVIMHLDMDCFFVSVGLKKHPQFRVSVERNADQLEPTRFENYSLADAADKKRRD